MKLLYPIIFIALSFALLSSSCKKHVVKPVDQLSLLPPATQTGANTFGCLLNGQAFVPKNRSILEGPIMQCNYIFLGGGYNFNVSGGNAGSNGTYPIEILVQTDSLRINEGQTIPLTIYNTSGMASGIVGTADKSGLLNYYTNATAVGQLHVTHMDTVKQIVSGTFYFTAIDQVGDTVKITDGRFDMPYTR